MTAVTTVAMRLWLKGSDWITNTGLRKSGPEPVGAGNDAHYTSPRFIGKILHLGPLHRRFNP